jgi:hypothetical protein
MGVGVEAGAASPSYAKALRQPAYGEYAEQPEVDAQDERPEQEHASDRFARRAKWPVLVALAGAEMAWLVALAYVIHRYVLSPVLG